MTTTLTSTEADVHTATPSLSNAAATWAGWAVTAVTAKFYRSHSDTARVAHSSKSVLSKPGSLGKWELYVPLYVENILIFRIKKFNLLSCTLLTANTNHFFYSWFTGRDFSQNNLVHEIF